MKQPIASGPKKARHATKALTHDARQEVSSAAHKSFPAVKAVSQKLRHSSRKDEDEPLLAALEVVP